MNAAVLTETEISGFERDGFVVIRQMYTPAQMKVVSDRVDAIAGRTQEIGRQMIYLEDSRRQKGKRILSRIEKFVEYDKALSDFIYSEKMIKVVETLLEAPALLFKEKVNFKMPGSGGFQAHQDIQPGWDEYAPYFLSVLVTIDPSTFENGCLELAAGHHKRGLIGRKWKPLEDSELDGIDFKPYPMEPGDVAFFDCFVPHQSAPNGTDRPRRNLYLTFNRASDGDHREKYFSDKRRSYPPDNEREPGKEYIFKV